MPRIPSRVWKLQQAIVRAAENKEWRLVELLGAEDPVDLHRLRDEVAAHFQQLHRREGFDSLIWREEADDESFAIWQSGIQPQASGEVTLSDSRLGSMTDEAAVALLFSLGIEFSAPVPLMPAGIPGRVPEVFVSYSTRDRVAAFATCQLLEDQGIPCWIAPRNILPGFEWANAIIDGIRSSKVTVLLLSEASNLSKYVLRELELTVGEGHHIIPVRLEDCCLSSSLKFFLASHQYLDAKDPPLELHLVRLAEAVRAHLQCDEVSPK